MTNQSSNNSKRIAKNMLFLYIRMAVLMLISLFTARVLLDKLGVEDYGIYNVVGGLAGMFTFFSSSLTNASQRYLNMALGKNDINAASQIVRQHFTLYLAICVIVVIAAETIGLWFVCNKLVIPPDRLDAAIWVYQFWVISLCAFLIGIIFDSQIIAHEDMNVYSYIGIYEGFSKLLICYMVSFCSIDRLVLYGFLLLLVTLSVVAFYLLYCKLHYVETSLRLLWNNELLKDTSSLLGWNTVSTLVYAINDTGINILLNMFFGPTINAARAVSVQVNNALNNFSSNFYTAVRPQLTKSYAAKEWSYLFNLFYRSSKYSFFLLWIFVLPISFAIDDILAIWLKEVPEFTGVFTVLILAHSLVYVLINPIWTLTLAVGKLKRYVGIGSTIYLSVFPLAYIALKCGYSPIYVFVIMLFVRIFYLIAELRIIHGYIDYSYTDYMVKVALPIVKVIALTIIVAYCLRLLLVGNFFKTIVYCVSVCIFTCFAIWLLGVEKNERGFVLGVVKNKIRRKR